MLQDLAGMHEVETLIGVGQTVNVADLEAHVGRPHRDGLGLLDHLSRPVDSYHRPGGDAIPQVDRDGAGTASYVEDVKASPQPLLEIGSGVLNRAPHVRA